MSGLAGGFDLSTLDDDPECERSHLYMTMDEDNVGVRALRTGTPRRHDARRD